MLKGKTWLVYPVERSFSKCARTSSYHWYRSENQSCRLSNSYSNTTFYNWRSEKVTSKLNNSKSSGIDNNLAEVWKSGILQEQNITLTPIATKIHNELLSNTIRPFLNALLHKNQNGFRNKDCHIIQGERQCRLSLTFPRLFILSGIPKFTKYWWLIESLKRI